ncbi:hypothetical protein ACFL6P_01445 [Candidatus Latescibacterota bacterium]
MEQKKIIDSGWSLDSKKEYEAKLVHLDRDHENINDINSPSMHNLNSYSYHVLLSVYQNHTKG